METLGTEAVRKSRSFHQPGTDLSKESIIDPAIRRLLDAARGAMKYAYCPYSRFPVGAALLCADGSIVTGCNVENAAYPIGTCAEKTAICKAVSDGHRLFKAVAVASDLDSDYISPCGACRQVLAEFGLDWDIYMTKPDGAIRRLSVRDLLPYGFTPESLKEYSTANGS